MMLEALIIANGLETIRMAWRKFLRASEFARIFAVAFSADGVHCQYTKDGA
jgi:hypothetical protein